MLTFGPIPSRRLGKSLGVNNIPPKYCSYFCIYCQIGVAIEVGTERHSFYNHQKIVDAVTEKVYDSQNRGEQIDYITFVPDGEPTLDSELGQTIRKLKKKTKIPIAVITNSSLLWDKEVRNDLMAADWVSVKVDTVDETIWRKLNHPSRELTLEHILEGTLTFSEEFKGELATETMLVQNINDSIDTLKNNIEYIAKLNPETAFLSIPTRPPAKSVAKPPAEEAITQAYQIYQEKVNRVETLLGYEGNAFAASGNAREDILSITAVHPMRQDAVEDLLKNDNTDWKTIENLINEDLIREIEYKNHKFYLRKLKKTSQAS